jgi:DnaA-like protein/replication protein O
MTNHDADDPVPKGAASGQRWRFGGFAVPTTTPVPDQLFDELMPRLAPAELVVTLYIIRRTFGFKKTSDSIALRQLTDGIVTRDGRVLDGGTGLSKATVARALNSLEEKGVIIRVRNRSDQRGDEPTTYQLNFLLPVSQAETPSLSHNETPRVSPARQAVSHQRDTQQTEIQQTDAVFSNTSAPAETTLGGEIPSKFRKGSGPVLHEGRRNSAPERVVELPYAPAGMARIADVLAAAGIAVNRARREPSRGFETAPAEPLLVPAANGGAPPERIDLVIEDISTKLRDTEHLASNITQARRLWQRSGQPVEEFVALLYAVRETVRWKANVDHRMPYFFKCVKVALGLEPNPNPAPQVPPTASAPRVGDGPPPEHGPSSGEVPALLTEGTNTQRLWHRVLARLEGQMTQPNFATYLRDTSGHGLVDGRLVVETPSDFVAGWLATKLYPVIQQALVAEAGAAIGVDFVVKPDAAMDRQNTALEALRRPRKARKPASGLSG